MYWDAGWNKLPAAYERCYQSYRRYNPDWTVHTLDRTSIYEFLAPVFLDAWFAKPLKLAHLADVLRIHLLQQYGGVWADVTTFCTKPFQEWLVPLFEQEPKQDFFLFATPKTIFQVSNWFLVSTPQSYVATKWATFCRDYWADRTSTNDYFWFHHGLEQMAKQDATLRQHLEAMVTLDRARPHALQRSVRRGHLPNALRQQIDARSVPIYKLFGTSQGRIVFEHENAFRYLFASHDLLGIREAWATYVRTNLLPLVGQRPEGNVYTLHHSTRTSEWLVPKQQNLIALVHHLQPSSILEVGFNAGFSALLMMMTKPSVVLTCVDINHHPYVRPCFEQIASDYPNVSLVVGDSRTLLPKLVAQHASFDLIHIDGGHMPEVAASDVHHCLQLSHPGTVLVVDDTQVKHIDALCSQAIHRNTVREYTFPAKRPCHPRYSHRMLCKLENKPGTAEIASNSSGAGVGTNKVNGFDVIYRKQLWGSGLQLSGSGSLPQATARIVPFIAAILKTYSIRTFVDVSCGAMTWLPAVLNQYPTVEFLGLDVSHVVIKHNRQRFADKPWRFDVQDFSQPHIQVPCDLILCRHTMMHLCLASASAMLDNLRRSAKFVLVTSHEQVIENPPDRSRHRIVPPHGDALSWKQMNVCKAPFNWDPPLDKVRDVVNNPRYNHDEWLYFYNFAQQGTK